MSFTRPPCRSAAGLLEIGPHHLDQFFCSVGSFGAGMQCGIDQMYADVIFDHFAHKAVDRASDPRDELKDIGAADFLLQRSLDGLDLPANAPHAVEKLRFLSDGVGHWKRHA